MSTPVTVIAVDGPAASGKSTVSRTAARLLGFNYVDTGAMYRTVTWKALADGVNVNDAAAVLALLQRLTISFEIVDGAVRMLVDGVFPGDALRAPRVAENVSIIAAIPEVRQVLVAHQRSLTQFGSLVMEGRDIGTVVFPDTPHKFYIDADPEERARRRKLDLEAMQITTSHAGVSAALKKRDQLDSGRRASPLQIANGATLINNTQITAEEAAQIIVAHVRQAGTKRGAATIGKL
jgi:cytidylate kinase